MAKIHGYNFSNHEYLKAHGKAPKGTGHWAFMIEGGAVENIAPETFIEREGLKTTTTFWVPGVWTLREAEKRAAIMAAEHEVPAYVDIEVAP